MLVCACVCACVCVRALVSVCLLSSYLDYGMDNDGLSELEQTCSISLQAQCGVSGPVTNTKASLLAPPLCLLT